MILLASSHWGIIWAVAKIQKVVYHDNATLNRAWIWAAVCLILRLILPVLPKDTPLGVGYLAWFALCTWLFFVLWLKYADVIDDSNVIAFLMWVMSYAACLLGLFFV